MELLVKQLAIPLSNPKTVAKWLVIAIRLGCHKTPTKSLVMSKGELFQRADLMLSSIYGSTKPLALSAVQSFDKLRTNGVEVWSSLKNSFVMNLSKGHHKRGGSIKNPFALSLSKGELIQRTDLNSSPVSFGD